MCSQGFKKYARNLTSQVTLLALFFFFFNISFIIIIIIIMIVIFLFKIYILIFIHQNNLNKYIKNLFKKVI
jgi:hypothetical protein